MAQRAILPISLFAVLLCLSPASAEPEPGLGRALAGGRIITGATSQRLIHFTFDDGPDPRTTPRLLDILDRLHVKATFFFSASRFRGGKRNEHAPEIARDALRRGHSIGSHSVDHVRMHGLTAAEVTAQLDENERLFEKIFGARTFLFRPPFGSRNHHVDRQLQERRYTDVLWNIGLADWVKRPPKALVKTFEKMLDRNAEEGQLGGVVLLHDTHPWTVDAVEPMVQLLRTRNCSLLQLGEPLYDIVDDLGAFHQSVAEAEPGTEAGPGSLPESTMAEHQAQRREAAQAYCRGKLAAASK